MRSCLFILCYLHSLNSLADEKDNPYNLMQGENFYPFVKTVTLATKDSVTIHDLVLRPNILKKADPYPFYRRFRDSTLWVKIDLYNSSTTKEAAFFTMESAYLSFLQFYAAKKDKILYSGLPYRYNETKNFTILNSYPTWKYSIDPGDTLSFYLQLLDRETRSTIKLNLANSHSFKWYERRQWLLAFAFTFFLLSMLLITGSKAIADRNSIYILYGIYLTLYIVDYLAIRGFGNAYLWKSVPFLVYNIRSLSHCLIMFSGLLFFRYLYDRVADSKVVSRSLLCLALGLLPFLVLYLVKFFFGGLEELYRVLWQYMYVAFVVLLGISVYLAIKKSIPWYLAVAVSLPGLGTFFRRLFWVHSETPDWLVFINMNSYFLTIALEILLITYYIFSLDNHKIKSLKRKQLDLTEKLFEKDQVQKALRKKLDPKRAHLSLKSGVLIQSEDLLFLKSDGHYLEYHLQSRKMPEIERQTMKEAEEVLGKEFFRCHRSYLVRLDKIKAISGKKVLLVNNQEIPLSRSAAATLRG